MIILRLTLHANIVLYTYPVVVFGHLSLQRLFPCTRSQQCFTTADIRLLAILNILNYHCRCIVTWHLLAANSKLVENFQPSSNSVDNKEKLSTNIRSEYASDFCHDRKSALNLMVYHRKISAFIKKQNALANWASIKDSI